MEEACDLGFRSWRRFAAAEGWGGGGGAAEAEFAVETVAAVAAAEEEEDEEEDEEDEEEAGDAARGGGVEEGGVPGVGGGLGGGGFRWWGGFYWGGFVACRCGWREGWGKLWACVLEVWREGAVAGVVAEADGEGGVEGWDLGGGVEEHLAEGPADFGVLDLVDGLEGVGEAFFCGMVQDLLGAVVSNITGGFLQSSSWDADAFVEEIDEPAGLEADFHCSLLVDLLSPCVLCDALTNVFPVIAAELADTLLVGVKVVGFVFVAHFEDLVRGVPVFTHPNEVVDVKVDGWHVYAVKKAGLVFAGGVLVEQRVCALQALVELAVANEGGSLAVDGLGAGEQDVAFRGDCKSYR